MAAALGVVGLLVGVELGVLEGVVVGVPLGDVVGVEDGVPVGDVVGLAEGEAVGVLLGDDARVARQRGRYEGCPFVAASQKSKRQRVW